MKKLLLLSAVVVAVFAASSQARAGVSFSISLGHSHHHAPVVVAPPPVVYGSHCAPAPVYYHGYAQYHHRDRHYGHGHRYAHHSGHHHSGHGRSHGLEVVRHGRYGRGESARGGWGGGHRH